MIKHYQKFEYNGLTFEANYDSESTPCKKFRVKIGDKEAFIDSHDLYALLMLYADEEQMSDMVKVTEKQVVMMRKAVKVIAQKDIAKGEEVAFIIEVPADKDVYEKWLEKNKELLTLEEAKNLIK
jgi:hypothetical protein